MASPNISFDLIPSSIRKPGKYFEFNLRLAVNTLSQNLQKLLILGQRLIALIEPARWQGGTLNDCTSGGTFTGTVKADFIVQISTAAATDQFKYSTDGGSTWAADTDITGAAQTLENGVTVTFGATTGHVVGDEWRFGAWPEPSVAEAVPTQIFSTAEAAIKFGYGSMVHLMTIAALEANQYLQLSICALDDAGAGAQAAGTITIAGTVTVAGAVALYVGKKKVEISVAKDDTAANVALALQNEIAKSLDSLPVTIAVNSGTPGQIDVTAKHKGTVGNQIGLAYETTASGITVTIVDMASGSTDPDVDTALTACFAEDYNIYVTPYNAQADIVKLRDHLDSVSGPLEQRPATGVYGQNGTLASATTLAGNINHGRIVSAYLRNTRSAPYELASAFASVMAYEEDPAKPLNTLELKKIHVPAIDDRLSRTEQESCLYNGVTPLEVGPGEKVQIVRAISTYVEDGQGVPDISLLDITTIRTLDYVRKTCRERIALRFPRDKKTIRVKNSIRSELLDVLLRLESLEIVENVEANKDGLIVEDDSQDPNRVNAKIPADVVNGLHIFAGRIDLIL